MPKVDVNLKRGYEASVPVEKIWNKFDDENFDKNLCVPLGENQEKEDRFLDLKKYHHVLLVGSALSGMGMFRRVALATLLKYHTPEEVQFVLTDQLQVSFAPFKNIDEYLVFPIIKGNGKALEALEWVEKEMDQRHTLLVENNCQDILSYNEAFPRKKMPRLVVMITELGELMRFDSEKTESIIVRIATLAMSVGVHLFVTSKQPSAEIITSLIRENMPEKIAFQLPGVEESQISIGTEGAEKLLGQGDMLVRLFDEKPERLQGYCLEEESVEKMVF